MVSVQPAAQPQGSWATQGSSTGVPLASLQRLTASLAEQVRAAEEEVRDAEQLVSKLKTDRKAAVQAQANLSKELERLAEVLPRLESDLSTCVDAGKKATRAHALSLARFRAYCEKKDPVSDLEKRYVALARLVRDGASLTPRQRMAWNNVGTELQENILKYLRYREHLQEDERALADEVAQLAARYTSLESQLFSSRKRLTEGAHELSRCKQILTQIPESSVATAEAVLSRKVATRDPLKAQLAAAESKRNAEIAAASQKQAAEEKWRLAYLERTHKAEAEQAAAAAAMPAARSWGSGQRGWLSNLPPGVRALVLAEAAGIDVGLDIFPDDDAMSPLATIREIIPPLAPAGPTSTIHADGLGVSHRQGNQTLVERANGPSALYRQEGSWEEVQYSNGVYGMRYYDDYRGVTQFDFFNPNAGIRTFGENPYEGNDYGQGWSQQVPLQ